MKKMTFVLCACLIFFAVGGCADSVDGRIESAKFSLDRCDPDDTTTHTNCTSAITTAEEVIASNADNLEAYLLASSGYFGRAGLNLLELVETFSDLTDSAAQDDYVVIADAATIAGDILRTSPQQRPHSPVQRRPLPVMPTSNWGSSRRRRPLSSPSAGPRVRGPSTSR